MGKKKGEEEGGSSAENIKVIVRCRPLSSKELEGGYKSCVDLNVADATVQVNHLCGNPDRWTFDGVINNTFSQKDIFTQFIMPMVDSVMEGFNATVFAYGQSGSGKTHTMTGIYDDPEQKGIIPRSFRHIFDTIKQQHQANPNKRFTLYCSFCELYNGKVRDLLTKQQVPLAVKENKDKTFFVQGANIPQVKFEEELVRLMEEGTERRVVDATELNATSSRSHSIFSIIIECTETTDDGDTRSVTSKLNLVDLAGSERQSKTGATGDVLKEGCNINLSLSALGTVIDTLVKGKGHVPFRSSPLTMLLKDSLGGSSKTCMFANIGPSEHNLSETVSTLRFADRAKQIKNKPVVNMDSKDQKIAELTEQVAELKAKLVKFETGGFLELEGLVEKLRERCGELEIDRDNAVKGREADFVDYERNLQSTAAQLEKAHKERDELREHAARLADEVKVAEGMAADEARLAKELFSMCSQEFGEPVQSADAFVKKLRELQGGVSRKQYEQVQQQLGDADGEIARLKGELELEQSQRSSEASMLQQELQTAQRKLEKAKEQLQNEQLARKHLVENHESPHRSPSFRAGAPSDELSQLKEVIDQMERERTNDSRLKEVEDRLKAVTAEKEQMIAGLTQQVDLLTAQYKDAPEAAREGGAVKQLLLAKDAALQASRHEVAILEAQLEEYRHMSLGRRRSSIKDMSEQREHLLRQQRDVLREELHTTAEHRDQLLDTVILKTPNDVAGDLQHLKDENARLREHLSELERGANSDASQLVSLQEQLARERKEFEATQAELIGSLAASDGGEHPLQTVIAVLRAEKQSLLKRLDELGQQLAAQSFSRAPPHSDAQADELSRLQALLSAPQPGDSELVGVLRAEIRGKDDELNALRAQPSAMVMSLDTTALDEERAKQAEGELRQQLELLSLEKGALASELESIRADLVEERQRRQALEDERRTLQQAVAEAKKESADANRRAANARNDSEAARADLQALQRESSRFTDDIGQLQSRLEERAEQMKKLREVVDSQKAMMEKMKAKLETQQQTLNAAKQELSQKDQYWQGQLAEQADHLQKMTNRRLEQQSEEHKKALVRKDDDMRALRKKVKKMDDKLDKAKSKYDEKVLEYAELQARMEEQKLEAMQALREPTQVQIESGQELIRDTLQDAKEAQRRKADLFAQGEVTSALAGLRAAGNAAVALRARHSTTAPPLGRTFYE